MRRKIPSLQALACFDAAARHQSYTQAAQELALTQSAVSRQIHALEDYLGRPLFTRSRHGVALTPAGSQYARQIAPRLQALERDTLDAMSAQAKGGVIHLAAVPTFATRWLIPRLSDFNRAHPEVVVHIDTRTRPFMFSDTGLDAAIYAATPAQIQQWAGTRATTLLAEEVIAVCAPALLEAGLLEARQTGQAENASRPQRAQLRSDLPPDLRPDLPPTHDKSGRLLAPQASPHWQMQARALAQLPLLQQSTRPDAWRLWLTAAGVADELTLATALAGPRFELFSMSAAAAVAAMGVALIPRLLVAEELRRADLVQAHPMALPGERYYYLVQPEGDVSSPSMLAFAHWLTAQCQDHFSLCDAPS